jgi:hypothetical protein
MQLSGTIYSIGETIQVSDKFKKREFILKTGGQYPQHILMEMTQDKCSILDKYKIDELVVCDINVKGRLYNDKQGIEKCFNSIECWKIAKDEF